MTRSGAKKVCIYIVDAGHYDKSSISFCRRVIWRVVQQ